MLSKNKIKLIRSLQNKKFREEEKLFVVEGKKSVLELLSSDFKVQSVICTENFLKEHKGLLLNREFELESCSPSELESISSFKTNETILAVAKIKQNLPPKKMEGLVLVLDRINDPGNLGTIIRTADWFEIKTFIASNGTVDFYNSKVLQASMGSFTRVSIYYTDLGGFLKESRLPVYAAQKNGKNLHTFSFKKDCCLILGSESHGISGDLTPFITEKIGIPGSRKTESLNVASAAAIFCDNYYRSVQL
jgi:TrmH family RNA methyltransferase